MEQLRQNIRRAVEALERGKQFVTHDIWQIGLPGEQPPHGFIIKQVRVAVLLVKGIIDETLLLRASALTVATMIFLVPFLSIMFAFIQTFNLGDQVYRALSDRIDAQLEQVVSLVKGEGDESNDPSIRPGTESMPVTQHEHNAEENNALLRQQLIGLIFPIFTEQSSLSDPAFGQNPVQLLVVLAEQGSRNPQAITTTGILFILSTVFGFMRNVESAFNGIWGVKRGRRRLRALSDYLMVTLLLPFAAAAVLGITAALESRYIVEMVGPFITGLRGGQFLLIWMTFSLLYAWVPNTRVDVRYALLGGLVAGVLWVLTSWGYVKFQMGLARYALFFSGFALFPLFLMWIFASWQILLFGALLTFAYQNEKTFAMERLAEGASYAYREALALRAMVEMAIRFQSGRPGLEVTEAAESWNVPTRLLSNTLDNLVAARLAVACVTDPVTWQPARAPESIHIADVVRAVREDGRDPSMLRRDSAYQPLYQAVEEGTSGVLASTVADLMKQYARTAPA